MAKRGRSSRSPCHYTVSHQLNPARTGAQFIIATHSPILLACPDAGVYELDDRGISPCEYDDLDTVRLIRGFLDAPSRFVHAALENM